MSVTTFTSPLTTSDTSIFETKVPLLISKPRCSLTYGSDIKRCKLVIFSLDNESLIASETFSCDFNKVIICNGIDDFPSVFSSNLCFCWAFQVTVPTPFSSPACLRFIQMSASVGFSKTAQVIFLNSEMALGFSFCNF